MKRLIIKEYLRILVVAIVLSVCVSIIICFLIFLNDRSVDSDMPQYLVRNIRQYISCSQAGITLEKEGKDRLKHHDVWLQIINRAGEVVFEENSKGDIPNKYSLIELTDAVLHSNGLKNYSVYMSEIEGEEGYVVLLGCDSHLVTKYTINIRGELTRMIIGSLLVFIVVTLFVVLFSSFMFSRKITNPIGDIIDNIDKIQKGKAINTYNGKKGKLFVSVFDSITKLETILKQNDKLRAEWIVNISHDIKSPLSTIKGYSELLYDQDYEYSSSEIKSYAEQILKSEEKIKELVDDLKTSNSLIEGKIVPNLEKVNIVELIDTCISNISSYYNHKNHIYFENTNAVEIEIDEKLFERCITNIICNAFVHNEKDVEVIISVSRTADGIIIKISDNGKGMSEEDVSHIFERYYRGTGSGRTEGTGLGLAIAKEIILLHGGKIEVDSKLGKGTVFIIQLYC